MATGTPILAPADGIAVASREPRSSSGEQCSATYDDAFGYFVIIFHPEGYSTLYAHLDSIPPGIPFIEACQRRRVNMTVGTPITRGQVIGYAGRSGTYYSHLHFELGRNESCVPDSIPGNDQACSYTMHVNNKIDPYDLYTAPDFYPPTGQFFTACGPNYLWTVCPPTIN